MNECKPLPVTLKTVTVIFSATLGLEVNHSASAENQGLTLVHVRAQLEQLQNTFMS